MQLEYHAVEYHAAQFMCNHIFVLFDCAVFCRKVSKILPDRWLPGESKLEHFPPIFPTWSNGQSVAKQLVRNLIFSAPSSSESLFSVFSSTRSSSSVSPSHVSGVRGGRNSSSFPYDIFPVNSNGGPGPAQTGSAVQYVQGVASALRAIPFFTPFIRA